MAERSARKSRRQPAASRIRGPAADRRLEGRVVAGLEWINRNLHQFSPLERISPLEKYDPAVRVQPFAELTILYERLRSAARGPLAARLGLAAQERRLRRFVLNRCEERAYAELARRMPSQAYALLLPYLCLRGSGFRSPFHEATLEQALPKGHLHPVEVVPHRVLDREYFLWKSGLLRREPNWLELYANTALAVAPDALHIDKDTAYAITHTLFYLSDWGRVRPPLDQAESERVAGIVDCLMVHYWRVRHWDLLGELLLNRASIHARRSHIVIAASAAFLNAWRAEGCIPGEAREIEELKKAPLSEHPAIMFRACYHTTLVGIMYCLSALENGSLRT